MVGSFWVCHWKKTFWVGGCDGIGGLAYLLFCAAYWSRQPRVFRRLSRSCLIMVCSRQTKILPEPILARCHDATWRHSNSIGWQLNVWIHFCYRFHTRVMINHEHVCDATWWHRSGSTLAKKKLVSRRHQYITWSNADLSSVVFRGTHLRAVLKKKQKKNRWWQCVFDKI